MKTAPRGMTESRRIGKCTYWEGHALQHSRGRDSSEPSSELGLLLSGNLLELCHVVVVALVEAASQTMLGKVGAEMLSTSFVGGSPPSRESAGRTSFVQMRNPGSLHSLNCSAED
jgi:hypothetical protein